MQKITESNVEPSSAKTILWQKRMIIPGTSWEICGFSRAAYRTGFYISALDLMLDAGPQNFSHPTHILVTHAHLDHIVNLPLTMIGRKTEDQIYQIYGHESLRKLIQNYIGSTFSANAGFEVDATSWYDYHGLEAGKTFDLQAKHTQLKIEVFECDHGVPTLSYGFGESRPKLKDEYTHLAGKEIGKLRKQGVQVTNNVMIKHFAFVCDTSIRVFDLNPTVKDYNTIFIECTFLLDDELENATNTKHIHWSHLKPYVKAHPEKTFVLFHFSQRYTNESIEKFFLNEKSNGITNVVWW